MRKLFVTLGAIAAVAVTAGAPQIASAREHHRYHRYYDHERDRCMHEKRRTGAIGAVSGTVGGALIGHAVGHGTGATLLGAGAGALAGNAIGRHSVRC